MSKSIDRVMDTLKAANCDIDQIAKSIIFAGETTSDLYLFITAGGSQVCEAKAAILTGKALGRAQPGVMR